MQGQDLQGHFHNDKSTGKYVCDKCSRTFTDFMKLVQHIAWNHGEVTDCQCELCKELQSTEPTGTGYICFTCDVMFDIAKDLQDHLAKHEIKH